MDYKPKSYNLLNVLTRWPETYHESKKLETKEVLVDRYRRSLLRLRFLHNDVILEQIHSDQYYEFGDFIDNRFRVTSSEKEGKIAILEMEKNGSIKDTETDERIPLRVNKDIYVDDNEIEVILRINIDETSGDEKKIARAIKNLNVGLDIPFFFNGDPNTFQWTSDQFNIEDEKDKNLLEPFQYKGLNFKAHDETYDLHLDLEFLSKSDSIKINKFPIIAYAFTDEGYKKIFQGLNVTPVFKLEKNLEFHLKITIY